MDFVTIADLENQVTDAVPVSWLPLPSAGSGDVGHSLAGIGTMRQVASTRGISAACP